MKVLVAFVLSCLLHKQRADALAVSGQSSFILTVDKSGGLCCFVQDNMMIENLYMGAMIYSI